MSSNTCIEKKVVDFLDMFNKKGFPRLKEIPYSTESGRKVLALEERVWKLFRKFGVKDCICIENKKVTCALPLA